MTLMDYPIDARFRAIEDRLGAIERDMIAIKATLGEMSKRIPSVWVIVGLILPLYAFMVLGFAGLFYFLLNYVKPGG